MIFLEIFREDELIKIGLQEGPSLETQTLQRYETRRVDWERITGLCSDIFRLIHEANRDKRLAASSLGGMKRLGRLLLDELFPPESKERLLFSRDPCLIVRIDDGLVQVPWELLFDGSAFFCLRWAMGRLVRTRQRLYRTPRGPAAFPMRILLIADPRGDLPAAYREGQILRDLLEQAAGDAETEMLSYRVRAESIREWLKDCNVLHYAGHADYVRGNPSQSGLVALDGKVTAEEIIQMSGGREVPSLVFINGCRSGQTSEWIRQGENSALEIFGVANAFLMAGARHYIGTFWEIQDELSSQFALCFYRCLLAGDSIGACVRAAREETIREFGEDSLAWATYVLYGDPSYQYARTSAGKGASGPHAYCVEGDGGGAQGVASRRLRGLQGEVSATFPGDFAPERGEPAAGKAKGRILGRPWFWGSLLALILSAAYGVSFWLGTQRGSPSRLLENTWDGLFVAGDLEPLLDRYESEISSGASMSDAESAALHARLGRIYARKGLLDKAIEHYRTALGFNPGDLVAKGNLCMALNRAGRYREAETCYEGLLRANPGDQVSLALLRSLERRLSAKGVSTAAEDRERLLDRLEQRARPDQGGATGLEGDPWTSRPISIALLGLEDRGGLSLQDGQTEAILELVLERLRASPRIVLVERRLIDGVLKELDLGSGKLADPDFALRIGRLLPARLLGCGSAYRDQDSLQINLRLIESETSRVRVGLSQAFPRNMEPNRIAERLAGLLLERIRQAYPLRGKVSSVEPDRSVWVDIGSRLGVRTGSVFSVLPPGETDPGLCFAQLRIVMVEEERSRAERIGEAKGPVFEGCNILEMPRSEE